MKSTQIKIHGFEISFINAETGAEEETHKTTYIVKKIAEDRSMVIKTIKADLDKAVGKDKRKHVVKVLTNKGKHLAVSE